MDGGDSVQTQQEEEGFAAAAAVAAAAAAAAASAYFSLHPTFPQSSSVPRFQ